MSRRRRGRSEGSIYFREVDQQWVGTISLGYDVNGKRKRRVAYGSTKGEVQEKLRQLQTDASAGSLPDASSLTMSQLLDRWLETSKAKVSPLTYEGRESLVRMHLKPRIGGMRVAKINELHIESLYADVHRETKSVWTARRIADAVSCVLKRAMELKLIAANPSLDVEKPKPTEREMMALDDGQVKVLLTAAKASNLFALVTLALGTGCRQGELLALTWHDIDLKKAILTVRKSLAQTRNGFIVKDPKTKAGRRAIALPETIVQTLIEHKARMLKAGLLSGPIFSTRTGGYLDKKNVLRAFRGVVQKANTSASDEERNERKEVIPSKLRFHDLRHTVASLLLSRGCSLRAVAQRLGHSKPTITLRIYAHCLPNDDAQLATELNRILETDRLATNWLRNGSFSNIGP